MGVQSYVEADIQSISREKLLVLLYEKMGTDLLKARQALAAGDRIVMADRINHSQQIIVELRHALDHNIGGAISRNLESLYDYLFVEQLAVLIDQDPRHVDNCLMVLKPLITAWREIPPGTTEAAAKQRARQHDQQAVNSDPAHVPSEEDPDSQAGPEEDPGGQAQTSSLFSVSA
jgi:flagellar protein FliS